MRKLHQYYLKKFLHACFNERPPIKLNKTTWDVNVLLNYLITLGGNENLECNMLAGKTILLIMLCMMCRKGEVKQIRISRMTFSHLGVTFPLGSPIKIFNPKTFVYHRKLQQLFIPELNSEPLLCLVETLKAYLG